MYRRATVLSCLAAILLLCTASTSVAQQRDSDKADSITFSTIGVDASIIFPGQEPLDLQQQGLLGQPLTASRLGIEWDSHEQTQLPAHPSLAARASKAPGMMYVSGLAIGAIAGWKIAKSRESNPLIGMTAGLGVGGVLLGPMLVMLTM